MTGSDQLDQFGDKSLSTLVVLGVIQMVDAITLQCMQLLTPQLFDQRVGKVQVRPPTFGE